MSGELRIPRKLLASALAEKKVKALRVIATAKLDGCHRIAIASLLHSLKIKQKTGSRILQRIIDDGWAGTDGEFLFPRSWRRIGYSRKAKKGGLYLTRTPKDLKKFEALCFAYGLKKIYRKGDGPHSKKRRVMPEDQPSTRYLTKALGLSQRRFERLKAAAQKYKFIEVAPQGFTIIGDFREIPGLKKNLKLPVFKKGTNAVVPERSVIRVLV